MKHKILFYTIALLLCIQSHAQNVAINADGGDPDPSAALDVKATDKGVLIPRVDFSNLPLSPPTGLLVYVTANGPDGDNVFYYYDGSQWQKLPASSGLVSSQWTTTGSNIYYNSGNVGIGNSSPKAPLEFANTVGNRKIVFYTTADNDHQFTGLGLNFDALRFQMGNTTGHFKFYGATSATTSNELFRIQGNGQIVIPALTTQGIIQNSATGVLSSTNGSANQVLKMNATGTSTEWGPAVVGVTGTAPVISSGGINPVISISPATTTTPGSMSAADKTKLDGLVSSQWSTNGLNIYFNAGKIGIGTATPIGLLDLGTTVANRKIVLYPGADNDHQYSGFGINYGAMRYQIANTEANHTFYAATSATVSNELFRIQGNGQIVIPAFTTQGIVRNSATGALSSTKGTAGQVLKMNADGTTAEWGMPTLQEVVASGNSASGRIRNVQNPTDLQDVATKSYVDNNSTTWQVGDFAHGGIVFWVDETGRHGLVCAKNDQSTGIRWYAGAYGNTQAKGDGPFAGEANTRIIIAALLKIGDDGGNYAARVCNEMETNINGYPYGGWYLPSFDEMLLMYENRAIIDATALANGGSAFVDGRYWSSTEKSYYDALVADFQFGYHFFGSKFGAQRVRAVRAF